MVEIEDNYLDVAFSNPVKYKDIKQKLENIAYDAVIICTTSEPRIFLLKKRKIKYYLNIMLILQSN